MSSQASFIYTVPNYKLLLLLFSSYFLNVCLFEMRGERELGDDMQQWSLAGLEPGMLQSHGWCLKALRHPYLFSGQDVGEA